MYILFKINDVVVYGDRGVYEIVKIDRLDFLDSKDKYYILEPVCRDGSTIYVKTTSNKVSMRNVISRQKAESYLSELNTLDSLYDKDSRARDKEYQDILKTCECGNCLRMLKGIKQEEHRRNAIGKKLNTDDDKNLKKVEKVLLPELSVVFGSSIEQVKKKLSSLYGECTGVVL